MPDERPNGGIFFMTSHEMLRLAIQASVASTLGKLAWYAFMALGVWLFFYVAFRSFFRHRRVSQSEPSARQLRREILHSLRSLFIFGLVTLAIVLAAMQGWTRMYRRVDSHGWAWFALSIGIMIVVHDAYFYWTHRLMHQRRLYRFFHSTHHLSTSPTPWAAYAFSPAEALVQAGIAPVILFTIPVHGAAFAIFMAWQITFNVFGHCGYEIFPRCFFRSRAGWVLNSVTHHAMHHEKFRANYSLYFNIWDRLMGTNHADYEKRFAPADPAALECDSDAA
jgi:lathosterol oxidase